MPPKKITFGIGFACCSMCLYDSLRYDDVVRHIATSKKCRGGEIVHKPLEQFLDHARQVEKRRRDVESSPVSTDSSSVASAASRKRRRTTQEYQELFEKCVHVYDFAERWEHINVRETSILRKIEELAASGKIHEIPGTVFGRLWGADAADALQVIVRGPRWVMFMGGVGPDGTPTIQKSQAFKRFREDLLVVPFLKNMPDVLNASEKTRNAVRTAVATVLAAFDTKSTKNELYKKIAVHLEREFDKLTTVDDPTLFWNSM
jgi:hypothetical protein